MVEGGRTTWVRLFAYFTRSAVAQIPVASHWALSLSKLVRVSLLRTTRAFLRVASSESSVSDPPRTLPFHLVSSLTSSGLQSSQREGGEGVIACVCVCR